MQQIKGAVLKARLTFVESQSGREGVARVLDRLPPDDQRSLRMLFTSNWYPVTLCHALDEAIVTELGRGRREVFEQLGAASAERNLGAEGVHAGYLTPGDPHGFLAKAPQVYAMYYEQGRREYARTGDTSAVLTTFDAANVDANDCLTVVGWYRKALELCGARAVKVSETECRAQGGRVCRYELSWV
jgi:uncharacterized protein (TIGR02265 family)